MRNTRSQSRCPNCQSTVLCKFHDLGTKMCHDCGLEFDWTLDEGQKPLFEGTAPDTDYIKEATRHEHMD